MKTLFTFSIVLALIVYSTNAQIIHVPGDQPSIQAGIDAASAGDTVLVADSTYYENIDFKGKAITVASHFLVNGDTSHISKTIIDGSQPSHPDTGSVVSMISGEDITSVLSGFTLTGGTGIKYTFEGVHGYSGGGVNIANSGGTVEYNIIEGNSLVSEEWEEDLRVVGAGIVASFSSCVIKHNIIRNNSIVSGEGSQGCGIVVYGEEGKDVLIENNLITGNSSQSIWGTGCGISFYTEGSGVVRNNRILNNTLKSSDPENNRVSGGGLWVEGSHYKELYNNIIAGNHSDGKGGGAAFLNCVNRSGFINNTVSNNTAGLGGNNILTERDFGVTSCNVLMLNNIIWSEDQPSDNILEMPGTDIIAVYNNITGGWEGEGNIDGDPMLDTSTFELLDGSPCIAAGVDSVKFNGTWYTAPATDQKGNIRPYTTPDQRVDLGAIESPYGCTSPYEGAAIINVPCELPSIQSAIDAASDGDTVLVANGRYYENIDFKGKAITVASHFLVDGDTSHISKTIIDGSQPVDPNRGTTVTMESCEDSTSVLCGFTITGGTASQREEAPDGTFGGGILCVYGGGKIESNIVRQNHMNAPRHGQGGGILCFLSDTTNLVIRYNVIRDNTIEAQWAGYGGGIDLLAGGDSGFVLFEGNTLSHNTINAIGSCAGGGGIRICLNSPSTGYKVIARNNSILYNRIEGFEYYPIAFGGGILFQTGYQNITLNEPDLNPWFYNNVISNNESEYVGGGMAIVNWDGADSVTVMAVQPVIINNTFVDNSAPEAAGLFVYDAHPFLMNNIFWDDLSFQGCTEFAAPDLMQPTVDDKDGGNAGRFTAIFNNIQGGWEGWGNIDCPPVFETGSFTLADGSPGIGYGKHSFEINGMTYYAPQQDKEGNTRPDNCDALIDMGAFESPFRHPNNPECVTTNLASIQVTDPISIYPNPCRDHLTIQMRNNQPVRRVEILGMDGRIFRIMDHLQSNPVIIDRGDIPSGLYILRLHTDEVYVRKVLVE